MINEARGNLLNADAEALVNTVNCVGYMGKGIALQFKQAFPANFAAYEKASKAGQVQPGRMFVYETRRFMNPKYIINFPTKRHWRGKSRIEDIESGLRTLVTEVKRLGIKSLAVPPLGCGNGGLDWTAVKPLILHALSELPEVEVFLYPPAGAPAAKTTPVRTKTPRLTVPRALLLQLMGLYKAFDYSLRLLEIQKLAYFLQEAGQPMRLNYEAGHYGPYATNLNKVLEIMEGHFIRGYGDQQKPETEIQLTAGSSEQASAFLKGEFASLERLAGVAALIDGFQTPYGLELLSSVHWIAKHSEAPAHDLNEAVDRVHAWNERKRKLLKTAHIEIAWKRLADENWIDNEVSPVR